MKIMVDKVKSMYYSYHHNKLLLIEQNKRSGLR